MKTESVFLGTTICTVVLNAIFVFYFGFKLYLIATVMFSVLVFFMFFMLIAIIRDMKRTERRTNPKPEGWDKLLEDRP